MRVVRTPLLKIKYQQKNFGGKMKKIFLNLFLVLILLNVQNILAQDEECVDETDTKIPALIEFHDIMHPIWHTAYPAKDIDALKGYVEEVNTRAEKIYNVKLPGILREKEAKWKKGVEEFKAAVEKYNDAANSGDDQALLDAAEELHTKYENLVRIIRPIVKELEDFHKVLYVIYHKYLPEKKWSDIKNQCDSLKEKAQKVYEAKLPKRLEAKTDEYKKLAQELIQSIDKLCKTEDEDLAPAVEAMHDKYVAIQDLFE